MRAPIVVLLGKEDSDLDDLRRELECQGGYEVEIRHDDNGGTKALYHSRVLVGKQEIRETLLGVIS